MDMQRAARSLRGERGMPVIEEAPVIEAMSETIDVPMSVPVMETRTESAGQSPAIAVMTPFRIADRNHAYQLLDEIAQYLARAEPHSPTPYLLRRAVAWGSMPLPELMREVMSQEGDLNRYFAMLGMHE